MTWQLSLLADGQEVVLTDRDDYVLTGVKGLAGPPITRISQRGPMQHGATDAGYRLGPRHIALGLLMRGGDDLIWLNMRYLFQRITRVRDQAVQLRLSYEDIVRQIDCYLNGTLEMDPDADTGTRWQRIALELVAPDPTWYDPNYITNIFALGGGGQAMQVPLTIPWPVGASAIDQSLPIYYPGSWDAFPIITVEGPIANCIITNTILGTKLDFTGLSIGAGEKRIIDCRYGYKSVVNELGQNRVYNLTNDSHLATFRIGSHPDVQGGYNTLRVQGTNITAGTRILVQYHVRYIGV